MYWYILIIYLFISIFLYRSSKDLVDGIPFERTSRIIISFGWPIWVAAALIISTYVIILENLQGVFYE